LLENDKACLSFPYRWNLDISFELRSPFFLLSARTMFGKSYFYPFAFKMKSIC